MNILKLKMLTKSDKWLIVILLAAALLGVFMSKTLFAGGGRKYVQISVNGTVMKTVVLMEGYREEFYIGDAKNIVTCGHKEQRASLARNSIKGYNIDGYNIIEINSTGARVKEAKCTDLICAKTGWVHERPQEVVCVPNRVVVRIVSDNDSGQVDDIAR